MTAAFAAAPIPADAVELKLAHFMSPKRPMDRFIMRPWSEEIAKLSKGSLTVRIYPGGALGKGPVAQGIAEDVPMREIFIGILPF